MNDSDNEVTRLRAELEAEKFSSMVAWTVIKVLAVIGGIYAGLYWDKFF